MAESKNLSTKVITRYYARTELTEVLSDEATWQNLFGDSEETVDFVAEFMAGMGYTASRVKLGLSKDDSKKILDRFTEGKETSDMEHDDAFITGLNDSTVNARWAAKISLTEAIPSDDGECPESFENVARSERAVYDFLIFLAGLGYTLGTVKGFSRERVVQLYTRWEELGHPEDFGSFLAGLKESC